MSRSTPFQRFSGPFDADAARHLLRRSGFGAEPARVAFAIEHGLDAVLDGFFTRRASDLEESSLAGQLGIESAAALIVGSMLTSVAPERAKLALFWHGHFATSFHKVDDAMLMLAQYRLFESLGAGAFHDLLRTIARDPAMLSWLDAEKNRRGHPNENFARELFELFALGIGNYTEADIQEAARAFTGFRRAGSRFEFIPELHDAGEKHVLGETGAFDGDAVVALCVRHPACPRFLSRKLLRYYGDPNPADSVCEAFADVLREHDLEIGVALKTLFGSDWFFAKERRGARIASPAEFVIGPLRSLGTRAAPAKVEAALRRLGQAILRPPTVKGWDGEAAWIHSASALGRIAVGQAIGHGGYGKPWRADDRAAVLAKPETAVTLLLATPPSRDARALLDQKHATRADEGALVSTLLSLPEASTV